MLQVDGYEVSAMECVTEGGIMGYPQWDECNRKDITGYPQWNECNRKDITGYPQWGGRKVSPTS
mgnify:CR=1 FL=1